MDNDGAVQHLITKARELRAGWLATEDRRHLVESAGIGNEVAGVVDAVTDLDLEEVERRAT
jgi:hypothetical protein